MNTESIQETNRPSVLISERDPITSSAMGLAFSRLGYNVVHSDRVPLTKDGLAAFAAVCVGIILPPVLGATNRASVPLIVATCYVPLLERQSMGAEALSGALQFQRVAASLPSQLARALDTTMEAHPPVKAPAPADGAPPAEPINRTPAQQQELVTNVLGQDDIPF